MATIAGHSFVWGVCTCGRRWTDIRNTTQADVGKPNIAHIGNINAREVTEIEAERMAEDSRIADAMGQLVGRVLEDRPELEDINIMVPF